jgi:hypothetical protein
VGADVSDNSEVLLVTDFMNFKIKPTQSFRGAHRGKVCMCVFIGVSAHTCMSICIYTVFLKKVSFINSQKKSAIHQCFGVLKVNDSGQWSKYQEQITRADYQSWTS